MYAIVEIGGKQFRVRKQNKLKVPHLKANNGDSVKLERVLFYQDDNGKNAIGDPLVKDMTVSAKVVEQGKNKKVIVFKKKRRKGYKVKKGHRQPYTLIEIEDIAPVKKKKTTKKTTATKQTNSAEANTTNEKGSESKPDTKNSEKEA